MVVANQPSRSGAVCVRGRDVNALMTAGQLINWGMPTTAAEMLNALDCQRTLPLYLQASLLPKAERGELVTKSH
ncbi:hypothetical protein HTS61_18435 [Escherichia coli]|nr:hypothetical protein [Escherichia coli]